MPNTVQLSGAIHQLTNILQQQQDHGRYRISVSTDHLQILSQLPQTIRQAQAATLAQTAAPSNLDPLPTANSAPAASIPAQTLQSKREQLNAIARAVKLDETIRNLGSLGETMVFASGDPDARLMLIGGAPDTDDEKQKKPFTGPAGQLLDKILSAMKLSRQEVYLSNVVKFRPQLNQNLHNNKEHRKPHQEEIQACLKYILAEIDAVKPQVIIAFGETAAHALLNAGNSVRELREHEHHINGIATIVTYHPAYLVHCESISQDKLKTEKGKVWNDMKLVMQKMSLLG